MDKITLKIDGKEVTVDKGATMLQAARAAGVTIPTLCWLEGLHAIGACRMCVVELQGARTLQASCVLPAAEGMVVRTHSPRVREARKMILQLILSDHRMECPTCTRNMNCDLQRLAREYGIVDIPFEGERSPLRIDDSSPSLIRDTSKCILCLRCVTVCHEVQTVGALYPAHRGFATMVTPAFDLPLGEAACVNCGQCAMVCPVGAIVERDDTEKVWHALADPDKYVVVQTAPAIRAAIAEEFGQEPGTAVTGKMVAALRRLGFDKVFDTQFTADLTILEEGTELLHRLEEGGPLPLITSCSPGWIKFIEHFYPDLLKHVSSCKSPQQMFGALAKTWYAQQLGKKPEEMFVVSVMPCTAKKFERQRPEMNDSGAQDVDVVLTTREAARMIKQSGVNLLELEDEMFDDPLGESTGAAVIFGASGGVMEAALRTVYEVVTKTPLPSLDFEDVRGLAGIKEATVKVGDLNVKVAAASGLGNARKLMDLLREGKADYHFIEIMACPGGCLGGGGQPIPTTWPIREARAKAIYEEDKRLPIRKSHDNPFIKKIYEEFLEEPLGEKSHSLLHTHYSKRGV